MSSAPDNNAMNLSRPTLFLSYASEDREAARSLRDALAAAGLDVWYDENELGGGDAWDRKIRQQIRDCDYFMPVISTATERRKEGYFRREWRLAAERTLDMADDLMFLLPVTIDHTKESGARVPEKFLAVQWLNVMDGVSTPALERLAHRLATSTHAPHLPPHIADTPRPSRATVSSPQHHGPPPMPPFPHLEDQNKIGHLFKFVAEILWWVLSVGWMLFGRAPKWLRVVLSLWAVIYLFSRLESDDSSPILAPSRTLPTEETEADNTIAEIAESFARKAEAGDESEAIKALAKLGSELAHGFASGIMESPGTDKLLTAVPFTFEAEDEAETDFLGAIFNAVYDQLAIKRAGETHLETQALADNTDLALMAVGKKLTSAYVLGAWVDRSESDDILQVRLVKTQDATLAWSGQYGIDKADPEVIADLITAGVLSALPEKSAAKTKTAITTD